MLCCAESELELELGLVGVNTSHTHRWHRYGVLRRIATRYGAVLAKCKDAILPCSLMV